VPLAQLSNWRENQTWHTKPKANTGWPLKGN
jgi:hypothetical protein